jgi:hypothetical protein
MDFITLPKDIQLLYFRLGLNADDDGFVEAYSVIKLFEFTEEDLKALEEKGLIKIFANNVVHISDWFENNYIPKDRHHASVYTKKYGRYLPCIQDVYGSVDNLDTEVKLSKVKISKVKLSKVKDTEVSPKKPSTKNNRLEDYRVIIEHFNQTFQRKVSSFVAWKDNCNFWLENYTLQQIKDAMSEWKRGGWIWKSKDGKDYIPSLETLFRTQNAQGKCDYIGQLLERSVLNSPETRRSLDPLAEAARRRANQ